LSAEARCGGSLAFAGRRRRARINQVCDWALSEDGRDERWDDLERERRVAATEWVAKPSRTSIDTAEPRAFLRWRRDPARVDRFVVRPETERFKVVDIWTGETAATAMMPQGHMSEEDALHMAMLLNRSVKHDDRSLRGRDRLGVDRPRLMMLLYVINPPEKDPDDTSVGNSKFRELISITISDSCHADR